MQVIKYKKFKSSAKFEKWQELNPMIIVRQISTMSDSTTEVRGSINISHAILVTYVETCDTAIDETIQLLKSGKNFEALQKLEELLVDRLKALSS